MANQRPGGDQGRDPEPVVMSGSDARQGEIILRTRRRRIIFIIGLAGLVVVAALTRLSGII